MGALVGHTGTPRGLWHAIEPQTGKRGAEVGGRRQDTVVWQRQALRAPCGLPPYAPEYGGFLG